MENKILEILSDMQKDLKEVKEKVNKIEYKMNDGFETLEIKIDELDVKLRKTNKRISDQLAETMEDIAELKLQ